MIRRSWMIILWGLVALLLHLFIHRSLFSLIPISISLPFLLTWLLRKPVWYLVSWALVAELLTTLPFGIITAVTFLPLIIHFLFRRIQVDLSFSFFFIAIFTIFLQTIGLFVYDIATLHSISALPWLLWGTIIGLTSLFGYSVCLVDQQFYPSYE